MGFLACYLVDLPKGKNICIPLDTSLPPSVIENFRKLVESVIDQEDEIIFYNGLIKTLQNHHKIYLWQYDSKEEKMERARLHLMTSQQAQNFGELGASQEQQDSIKIGAHVFKVDNRSTTTFWKNPGELIKQFENKAELY